MTRSKRAKIAIFSAAFSILVIAIGSFTFYRIPLVPFVPVCEDAEYRYGGPQRLHRLNQPVSHEFNQAFMDYMMEPWNRESGRIIAVSKGHIYVTPAMAFSYDEDEGSLAKFGAASDLYSDVSAYWKTRYISQKIFHRRKAEGVVTDDFLLRHFAIKSGRSDQIRPARPGECGLTEELILQGGRFARD